MKKILLRAAVVLVGIVVVLFAAGATTAHMRYDRTFDIPDENIVASTDSAVIERGAYLVYGPAHCAYCHSKQETWSRLDAGERVPLSGGFLFDIGIAKITTPNLTPDPETGIGNIPDGKIARMLRHNVRTSGVASIPFMEFQNLSDEDLIAVISYLRSQPPVKNQIAPREFSLMGKAIMSFLIKPSGPTGTPPAVSPPAEPTLERGKYLVTSVADCAGCHTKRSQTDGSYLAPKLSGGTAMAGEDGKMYTPPNLTPDPKTGHIVNWTEDQFIQRFRAGPLNGPGTHMPWRAYGRMSDDDLRAIFRYLKTVPPTDNEPGPLVAEAKTK